MEQGANSLLIETKWASGMNTDLYRSGHFCYRPKSTFDLFSHPFEVTCCSRKPKAVTIQ
jgi:hypothetical protein